MWLVHVRKIVLSCYSVITHGAVYSVITHGAVYSLITHGAVYNLRENTNIFATQAVGHKSAVRTMANIHTQIGYITLSENRQLYNEFCAFVCLYVGACVFYVCLQCVHCMAFREHCVRPIVTKLGTELRQVTAQDLYCGSPSLILRGDCSNYNMRTHSFSNWILQIFFIRNIGLKIVRAWTPDLNLAYLMPLRN